MALNPNATGSSTPLPSDVPGTPGRESHERDAAYARGTRRADRPRPAICAPESPGLDPAVLFSLVAENVRDYAIFLVDPDGVILCWGQGARLMKWWTREEAEGAHLRLLYPDGGSEDGTAEDHLLTAARVGEYCGEGHRVRRDGSSFWAYVTLTALRNAEGALVGFSKVTRDFTARRAVEASLIDRLGAADPNALADEYARLKRLVAGVSHELRTPLNALLGWVAMLERDVRETDPQRSHVDRIKRNGEHLMQIVNDVLDLSRADSGSLAVEHSVKRLGPAVQEAIADVEPQIVKRRLVLKNAISGGAGDLPYLGDDVRVRQIIVNLLTNAVKFTEPGGQITVSGGTAETVAGVSLPSAGPWIYVRVEDTGRGIPADRLTSVFEPYQQVEALDQRQGTGLGLSISRRLARAMGGDITVESAPGVGSSFTLWLPIAPSEPVPR